MPPPENKRGFRFYHDVLGNPKYVVAPMVDASELAWRMLARKYNAQLCYTYELFEFSIVLKNIIIIFSLITGQCGTLQYLFVMKSTGVYVNRRRIIKVPQFFPKIFVACNKKKLI